jgi:V/A-type H+-transporting ATPase subunit K
MTFSDLFNNADTWIFMACALSMFLAGAGSAKGVSIAGQAAAGVVTEEPKKFILVMILEALPSTQGIYGFVIAFLMMGKINSGLSVDQGIYLALSALPVGIVGLVSGIAQGKAAAASIGIVAKRSDGFMNGTILTLMVEIFAILAFLITFLLMGKV